jgi:hypothetical protein
MDVGSLGFSRINRVHWTKLEKPDLIILFCSIPIGKIITKRDKKNHSRYCESGGGQGNLDGASYSLGVLFFNSINISKFRKFLN